MAIASSGNEGWPIRMGRFFGGINESCTFEGATSVTRSSVIASGFTLTDRSVIDGLYSQLDSQKSANSGWINYLATTASDTLIQMAIDGASPPLASADATSALNALIAQMDSTSQTVQKPTISASSSAGSGNVGNGTCVVSVMRPTGVQADMVFGETITLTCTDDGYPGGGSSSGSEPFTVVGQIAADSSLAWNWPAGSGANTALTVIDPSAASSGALTNGSFDDWTSASAAPASWTVTTGTVPTTIARSSDTYNGGYAMTFIGNGSELTAVRQSVDLDPSTVYHFNILLKTDGSVAAGVLRLRLVNADANTTVNDDAGNAISFTKTVSTLTSSYTAFNGTVMTPAVLPDNLSWEIGLSTAMTNTEVLYLDDVQVAPATIAYLGGPGISLFRGSTDFATGDLFEVSVSTNAGVSTFCRSFDRVFGLRQLGLQLPSASSPTVADNLINP